MPAINLLPTWQVGIFAKDILMLEDTQIGLRYQTQKAGFNQLFVDMYV